MIGKRMRNCLVMIVHQKKIHLKKKEMSRYLNIYLLFESHIELSLEYAGSYQDEGTKDVLLDKTVSNDFDVYER